MKSLHSLGLLALIMLVVGCGGEPAKPIEEPPELELKEVDAADLPKLAEPLPPVPPGENWLEVAPPEGWDKKHPNVAYLCAFTKEKGVQVPAIVVKLGSKSVKGFKQVTPENVLDFAAALRKMLSKEIPPEGLLEDIQPMVIGENAFARYVRKATLENEKAEMQVLVTQHNGRMFMIELRVRPDKLLDDRDVAYAVAAGLRFPTSEGVFSRPETPMTETPEAQPDPAPAKPAE